jgi:putative two-component system response regulator
MDSEGNGRLILVVDGDVGRHTILTRSLRAAGYEVASVAPGQAAVEATALRSPEAVLVGVGGPGGDGPETCRQLRADPANQTMPVIVVTNAAIDPGSSGLNDIIAGLDAGADDFLEAPFVHHELLATIRGALQLRRATAEMHPAHGLAAVASDTGAAAQTGDDSSNKPDWPGMAGFAYQLALKLGLDEAELKGVVFGALVHDIGNLGIPDAILSKPGPLTEAERTQMRRHPEIGEGICRSFPSSSIFAPVVRHHHERWDGFGYPDQLRGEAIPIGARIVGLVDAFDAMVHERPFRPALSIQDALAEIQWEAGRQFDPGLVPIFLRAIDPKIWVDIRRS